MYKTQRYKFHPELVEISQVGKRYEYITKNGCWMVSVNWPLVYVPGGLEWVYGGVHRKKHAGGYDLHCCWDVSRSQVHKGLPGDWKATPEYIKQACLELATLMFEERGDENYGR